MMQFGSKVLGYKTWIFMNNVAGNKGANLDFHKHETEKLPEFEPSPPLASSPFTRRQSDPPKYQRIFTMAQEQA
jgi:hypothetical protein